jgi:hypothetical protein
MKRPLETVPIAPPMHRTAWAEFVPPPSIAATTSMEALPHIPTSGTSGDYRPSTTTNAVFSSQGPQFLSKSPSRPTQAPGLSRTPCHKTSLLAAKTISSDATWQQIQATGACVKRQQKARPVKKSMAPVLVATAKADLASIWEARAKRQTLELQAPAQQMALQNTPPAP